MKQIWSGTFDPRLRRVRDGDFDVLIAIHIPKTGGITFRQLLEATFAGRIWLDYSDSYLVEDPEGLSMRRRIRRRLRYWRHVHLRRPPVRCVQGHFPATKYQGKFRRPYFMTWVRAPVDRVVSHYEYWLREPDPLHSICRRLHAEDLSLAEFAEIPSMRNLQSRYLEGVPLDRFDFIDVTERFDEFLPSLVTAFGLSPDGDLVRANTNPEREGRRSYDVDPAIRDRIAALNERDMELYERVKHS